MIGPVCLTGILCAAFAGHVLAAEQLTPVPPDSLLKVLPKPAPGWKVQSSEGETYYSSGLQARATRIFEYVPEDPQAAGAGATCKMTLTDTAGNTSRLGKFRDFKIEEGDGYKKLMVMSYPTIVREIPNYGVTVTLLMKKRFTLDFLLKGLTLDKVGPWIEASNLELLGSVREEPMDIEADVIQIVKINELNPDLNRKYPLALSDRKAIQAGLENLEDIDLPGDAAEEQAEE